MRFRCLYPHNIILLRGGGVGLGTCCMVASSGFEASSASATRPATPYRLRDFSGSPNLGILAAEEAVQGGFPGETGQVISIPS